MEYIEKLISDYNNSNDLTNKEEILELLNIEKKKINDVLIYNNQKPNIGYGKVDINDLDEKLGKIKKFILGVKNDKKNTNK